MLNCTIILQAGDNSGAQEAAADSQWIALIGLDGNVWLVDVVTGEKKQITQDGAPKAVTSTAKLVIYYCGVEILTPAAFLALFGGHKTNEQPEIG